MSKELSVISGDHNGLRIPTTKLRSQFGSEQSWNHLGMKGADLEADVTLEYSSLINDV